jgi:YD repeat-containing protein
VTQYDRNGNVEEEFLNEPRPGSAATVVHQHTLYRYDAIDRLTEIVDANGESTKFGYDAAGNRIAVTDPEGHVSRVEYDAMNRPVRTIDANGNATITEYDLLGRILAVTDPTGLRSTRAYDEIGNLVEVKLGSNPSASRKLCYNDDWQLKGCRLSVPVGGYHEDLTDPKQKTTVYDFDELGRVTRETDDTPAAGITQLTHDLRGMLTQVIDPLGATTIFDVDALGRVEGVTRPYATAPLATQYDSTGNAIAVMKPDGCILWMSYDVMGRLVERRNSTETSSTCPGDYRAIDDRYGYDARGLLVAAQNAHVGLIREYDALGRLTRETDDRFGTGIGYQYDKASRLTAKVYPDGKLLHVAYDAAGRPVGITDPTGDTTRYVYDAAGRRVQTRSTASQIRSELTYNALGQLTDVASFRADGSARPVVHYPSYDAAGNREQRQDDQGTTDYAYDALHRLITADPPGATPAVHYAYDAAGNRIQSGQQDAPTATTSWPASRRTG